MKVKTNRAVFIISLSILLISSFFLFTDKSYEKFENQINKLKIIVTTASQGGVVSDELLKNYYSANQKYIDVKHYEIRLNLNADEKTLKGRVTISGQIIDSPISSLDFNLYDNMRVSEIKLNNAGVKFIQNGSSLSIKKALSKDDTFIVSILYEGTPHSLGFGSFNFATFDDESVIYSLSEPVYASTWFPCNDIPTDKASADIYITNDSSKVSVSNGILIGVKTVGDRRTYHWKTKYNISSYLFCVYSANYSTFEEIYTSESGIKMPVKYYVFNKHLQNAKKDFAINLPALKYFSTLFGEYPFIEEKYGVAEFLWNSGAMEHQTITGIGEKFVSGKGFFKDIYIHELAHQWWGDAVSPKTWKDVWLNEGFATYSEALFWENRSGRDALISTMISKFGEFEKGKLYNPGSALFGKLIYNKGAWVLHMLRRELGTKNFYKILRLYYKKFKYSNASTQDFKNLCEEVSKKDLNYFFKQWVYEGQGILNLKYSIKNLVNRNNVFTKLELLQSQEGFENYHFPLDVRINLDGQSVKDTTFYISSIDTLITLNFGANPKNIQFDRNNWLLATIKEMKN